jgi:bifunctional non-homologous end joining protein LigD
MQPAAVPRPFHHAGWIYEEKYDGWRLIAYKNRDQVRLIGRSGRDHSKRFPSLAAEIGSLRDHQLIFDGEVAIFDASFRSRFDWAPTQATSRARDAWLPRSRQRRYQ